MEKGQNRMNRSKFYKISATRSIFVASNPAVYGSVPTYTAGDTFKCAFDLLSGSEGLSNQKEIAESTHYMECSYGVTLDVKDRIIIDSSTYEIMSIDNPMNMNVCLEVLLRIRK